MWINLLIAAVSLVALLAGLYLVQRRLKGEPAVFSFGGKKPTKEAPDDLGQFIAAYRRDKARGVASGAAATPAPSTQPAPPRPATPVTLTTIRPKTSFLVGPNKLLYLVLRTALPDHQIFANVRLADAVQVAGPPPTPHARAQLAQARVDFAICNKALAVVALVDVTDGNRADDVLKRQIEPQLAAAGGRYLRIAPNAIPKPAEARSLVCGSPL